MSLIIGVDNFGEAVRRGLNFIDKSLFVKELLDSDEIQASVITRPRRFGKTFNLSMLHHFFAPEVNGISTSGLFQHLKITKAGDAYMAHQGKYPVIFVTFKSVSDATFEGAYEKIQTLVSGLYREHGYLLESAALSANDKEIYERILKGQANQSLLAESLKKLAQFLYLHYGTKSWLLIDEYDAPIQAGYLNNHYGKIIEFMRGMFGSALKGNDYLHRAVITGILRISKESLFSGVNNLKVYSLLNERYAEHFGFIEQEVDTVFKQAGLEAKLSDIKAWYNGYTIGGKQMYNPWSIANCVYEKGLMRPYWVNTSGEGLIKASMALADIDVKEQFEYILRGKPIEVEIDENMIFGDFKNSSSALWSLLLFSGYLTAVKVDLIKGRSVCFLKSPNKEVAYLYEHIILSWFKDAIGENTYRYFLSSLTEGHLDEFLSILKRFLEESASHFDVKGHHPEKFYHGFVLGLIVGLSDTHTIESNRESGWGRYDVLITPKDPTKLGLILEFKVAGEGVTLEEAAKQALVQIAERNYEAVLRQKGIGNMLKIGLAFRGKTVEMAASGGE